MGGGGGGLPPLTGHSPPPQKKKNCPRRSHSSSSPDHSQTCQKNKILQGTLNHFKYYCIASTPFGACTCPGTHTNGV